MSIFDDDTDFRIDDNKDYKRTMDLYREGRVAEAMALDQAFVERGMKERDHCSCRQPCRWHGKCKECMMMHRGHRDHLPVCMQPLLLDAVSGLLHLAETDLPDRCAGCSKAE